MGYIDAHKEEFGVEPICTVLQFAPSTYYAAKSRPPSARALSDQRLGQEIQRIHEENYGVYGIRKVWHQIRREGEQVGRDQVGRIMATLGLEGVRRGKAKRTTIPNELAERPSDWSITSSASDHQAGHPFATWSGFCYTALSPTPSPAMLVGGYRNRCALTWPSTLWRWPSALATVRTSQSSSITATAA